ncbi:MAG: hypothetical protein LBH28_07975, partial [Oscillospiraceae bacterium]|nr:hypothetical protein [Oscillospiraceae bacterium]
MKRSGKKKGGGNMNRLLAAILALALVFGGAFPVFALDADAPLVAESDPVAVKPEQAEEASLCLELTEPDSVNSDPSSVMNDQYAGDSEELVREQTAEVTETEKGGEPEL